MRRGVVLVFFAGWSWAHASTDIVTAVEERLGQHDNTTGRFTQTAVVAALSAPVLSAGRFTVSRRAGFLWQIEQPIAAQFSVSIDGAEQNETDTPLRWIASIIDASLAGDIDSLTSTFAVDGAIEGDAWQLVLIPRARAMRRAIARIDVGGAEAIRTVRIEQANGDAIEIEFYDIAHPHQTMLKDGR